MRETFKNKEKYPNMKKWILYMCSFTALLTVGCQKHDTDTKTLDQQGIMSFSLTTSSETIAGVPNSWSKSSEPLYAVEIVSQDNESVEQQWDDHTAIPNSVSLKKGNYTARASHGDKDLAGFEAPAYYGEADFTITPTQLSSVSITATLSNVVFTTSFDDKINANFTKADLLIYDAKGGNLLFTIAKADQGRLAYLPVKSNYYWVLSLTNTQNSDFMLDGVIEPVVARERYDLKFSISDQQYDGEGLQQFDISIDRNLELSEHTFEINPRAGTPPSVSLSGAPAPNYVLVNSDIRNTDALFAVAVPAGVSEFWFFHDDSYLKSKDIPQAVDLKNADENVRQKLFGVGISYGIITGDELSLTIDFSGFCNSPSTSLGSYDLRFSVTDNLQQYLVHDFTVEVLPDQDHMMASNEPWARFAHVQGEWLTLERSESLTFEYKKASQSDWIRVPVADVTYDEDAKRYNTTIHRLEDQTQYNIRTYSDEKVGKEFSFTTQEAVVIPNIDFLTWSFGGETSGLMGRVDSWYPNSSATNSGSFWSTGNEGTAMTQAASKSITYPFDDPTYGKVVKMESIFIDALFTKTFAAGNIYTGYFKVNAGDPLVSAKMGRPYNGRPLGLKGRYKYKSTSINKNYGGDGFEKYLGTADQANIYIKLEDWGNASIQPESFGDDNNTPSGVTKQAIGAGNLIIDDSDDQWVEFYLPIDYVQIKNPTHITMVATSSLYGENFCGGEGSELLIHGFELIWDPLDIP